MSDKILRDKAFNITKNSKYDRDECGLASMVYEFFDRKISGAAVALASKSSVKNENISNKELAEELHKPIIRKPDNEKLIFYKQYLGCWSCWYAINKQI